MLRLYDSCDCYVMTSFCHGCSSQRCRGEGSRDVGALQESRRACRIEVTTVSRWHCFELLSFAPSAVADAADSSSTDPIYMSEFHATATASAVTDERRATAPGRRGRRWKDGRRGGRQLPRLDISGVGDSSPDGNATPDGRATGDDQPGDRDRREDRQNVGNRVSVRRSKL